MKEREFCEIRNLHFLIQQVRPNRHVPAPGTS
jgi:hypothetical protein